MTLFHTETEGI